MKDYTKRAQGSGFVAASPRAAEVEYDQGLRTYLLTIFNYMAAGLGVTGVVAFGTAHSPELLQAIFGTPLKWLVMLAPLGFVMYFSARIDAITTQTAQVIYWLFAGVMGLSMATIFLAYTGTSIARTFFVTAALFGAMSIYGHTTKKDLSGVGSFLFMGLIGIIIASLVNIFLKSTGLEFAVSALGVLIFTGLTAYDMQRLKHTYHAVAGDAALAKKYSIMGALQLYLDFINLFMMLLRFMGDRR